MPRSLNDAGLFVVLIATAETSMFAAETCSASRSIDFCMIWREFSGVPTLLFTKENAAEMAKRSHLPTSARYEAKVELPATPIPADKEFADADEFRRLRLARVRKQLDKIDAMLAKESDPGKIDRLASAAIRLNEQERQLSNRSLPPTLKASQVKAKRSSGTSPEPESA